MNVKTVSCPTCQKPVVWNEKSPWRPFCSKRCRLIDLGEWLDENHAIPGESIDIGNLDLTETDTDFRHG